jgi:hypothetical protein
MAVVSKLELKGPRWDMVFILKSMKVDRLVDGQTHGTYQWSFREVLFLWRFSANPKWGGLLLRGFACTKWEVLSTSFSHEEVIFIVGAVWLFVGAWRMSSEVATFQGAWERKFWLYLFSGSLESLRFDTVHNICIISAQLPTFLKPGERHYFYLLEIWKQFIPRRGFRFFIIRVMSHRPGGGCSYHLWKRRSVYLRRQPSSVSS